MIAYTTPLYAYCFGRAITLYNITIGLEPLTILCRTRQYRVLYLPIDHQHRFLPRQKHTFCTNIVRCVYFYFIEIQLVQAVLTNCLVIIALGALAGEKAMIRLRIIINEKNFHSIPSITGTFLLS